MRCLSEARSRRLRLFFESDGPANSCWCRGRTIKVPSWRKLLKGFHDPCSGAILESLCAYLGPEGGHDD